MTFKLLTSLLRENSTAKTHFNEYYHLPTKLFWAILLTLKFIKGPKTHTIFKSRSCNFLFDNNSHNTFNYMNVMQYLRSNLDMSRIVKLLIPLTNNHFQLNLKLLLNLNSRKITTLVS